MLRCAAIYLALHAVTVIGSPTVVGNDMAVRDELLPLIRRFCADCHGDESPEAGIQLSTARGHLDMLKQRKLWLRALDQIRSGAMPPSDPRPSPRLRRQLISGLESALNEVDWNDFADSGRQSLTRMTSIEYRNSIRDLFGVDLRAGIYLPRDPEGQTGFANDRASLSFPRTALEAYLKEAERAVNAVLGYGNAPWQHTVEMEAAWARSADKAVSLTLDKEGVVVRDPNAPFHFSVDAPFAGLYRMEIRVKPIDGEPVSGLTVFLDGRFLRGFTVRGSEYSSYTLTANLPAGSSSLTVGFSDDFAAIFQPKFPPRTVPAQIQQEVKKREYPPLEVPEGYPTTRDAMRAFRNFELIVRQMIQTRNLAELLIERDFVDFERNTLNEGEGSDFPVQAPTLSTFRPTKVPLNLTAGKVAQLLGVPQKELEETVKRTHGFDFNTFAASMREYKRLLDDKYPQRAQKVPGKLAIDRVVITSHSWDGADETPDWLFAQPATADGAQAVLRRLGDRAYGRPINQHQLAGLMRVYESGVSAARNSGQPSSQSAHREGLRDAMIGLLVSPPFLLRFTEHQPGGAFAVGSFELASRLSHFLWLSIPDDRLRRLAEQGSLANKTTLRQEMERMTLDPRFDATCAVFTEQWLDIGTLLPSGELSQMAIDAMQQEPGFLLRDILRENRSLLELLVSDYTYLNAALAHHYDIEGVVGSDLRRVPLTTKQRGGLLGMGAMLASTSTPERTSPVARGAWIVEILLGKELPLPPPSVPELKVDAKARTVREELELHRQSRQCASCHDHIDPYGFALENFDRVGAWRAREEGGRPIDASTTLDDGTVIRGLHDFKSYLHSRRQGDFIRNLTVRMFEFALGRELQYYDEQTVQETVARLERDGYRGHTLLQGIIESDAFRLQNDQETKP